jgi:hypothetical protein
MGRTTERVGDRVIGYHDGKNGFPVRLATLAGDLRASWLAPVLFVSSARPGLLRGSSAGRLVVRFSVVVPLHRLTPAAYRLFQALDELDYDDFEVLVVSDRPVETPPSRHVRLVTTGSPTDTSPAEKRDVAAAYATGDALAYIDDDAYPARDWLRVAASLLRDASVDAIGGPGLTPPGDRMRERIGGAVYESVLGSGPLRYRFTPRPPRSVDDYPAFNLIVRTEVVQRVGGWASTFYGGEDTVLCRRLAESGVLVHYDPRLVVFHHRRPVFTAHMRQVHNVGRHRGHFLRSGDPSSRHPVFFAAPIAVIIATASLVLALAGRSRRRRVTAAAALMSTSLACPDRSPAVRAVFPFALLAHHVAYTWGLITGLFTPEIDR